MWCGIDVYVDPITEALRIRTLREFENEPVDCDSENPYEFDFYGDDKYEDCGDPIADHLTAYLITLFVDMLIREFGDEYPKFVFPMNDRFHKIREKIESIKSL